MRSLLVTLLIFLLGPASALHRGIHGLLDPVIQKHLCDVSYGLDEGPKESAFPWYITLNINLICCIDPLVCRSCKLSDTPGTWYPGDDPCLNWDGIQCDFKGEKLLGIIAPVIM
jgi:hypothetical protein